MTAIRPTEDEAESLRAFREAALQVRNASIIANGVEIGFGGAIAPTGEFVTRFQLLAAEPFRSLAMSIRLVYMQGEPANYFRICNILYRCADAEVRELVKLRRAQYQAALEGKYVQFALHGDFEGTVVGPQQIFDAWLYGVAFHQDADRRPLLDELSKYQDGAALPFAVHMVALRLAGAILDLDDIVADLLNEDRVARIGARPPGPAA